MRSAFIRLPRRVGLRGVAVIKACEISGIADTCRCAVGPRVNITTTDGRLHECLGKASAVQELVDEVLAAEELSALGVQEDYTIELRDEITRLKAQVRHEIDQKSEMASNYTDAALDRDRAERDNKKLKTRLSARDKQCAHIKAAREEAEADLKTAQSLSKSLQSQLHHEGNLLFSSEEYLRVSRKDLEQSQADFAQLKADFEASQRKTKKLKDINESHHTRHVKAQSLIDDLKSGFYMGFPVRDWKNLLDTISELYATTGPITAAVAIKERHNALLGLVGGL